jgi:hypothetical protein
MELSEEPLPEHQREDSRTFITPFIPPYLKGEIFKEGITS